MTKMSKQRNQLYTYKVYIW